MLVAHTSRRGLVVAAAACVAHRRLSLEGEVDRLPDAEDCAPAWVNIVFVRCYRLLALRDEVAPQPSGAGPTSTRAEAVPETRARGRVSERPSPNHRRGPLPRRYLAATVWSHSVTYARSGPSSSTARSATCPSGLTRM